MAWAADYDPSKRPTDSPHTPEGRASFAGNDGDSDSELVKSPFDLCLARSVVTGVPAAATGCLSTCCCNYLEIESIDFVVP